LIFAAALATWVAGAWLLQQQAQLPPAPVLAATAALALATLGACGAALARAQAAGAGSATRWILGGGLLVAAAALGASHAAWFASWRLADQLAPEAEGRDVQLTGVVAGLPARLARGTRFEFDVESVETAGVHVPPRISLGWFGASARVRPGERWAFTVRLRRPHGTLNPGGFDLEAWMLERNLRATGSVREAAAPPRTLATMVWHGGYAIDRARHFLRERLEQRLQGERYAGVIVALVLGDQRAIDEDDWLLFNRTGIAHLVSISGLHITMIAGLFALAAGFLWRRSARALALAPAQSVAALAAVISAWAYCLLAGWGVPAQRTFFMLATVAAATFVRLPTRPVTTLGLAAAVVTLADPWAVLAPGFWLSFGAVAAIFFAASGRSGAHAPTWRERLREAARVQLVVTLALVPLTVALFQQVSLVSPLANAVAIPVISLLVTPLALVAACLVALPEPLAALAVPLLACAHALISALAQLLQWGAQLPASSIVLAAPPAWATVLGVAGVAWLLAPPGWPMRWAGAVWLLPLVAWPVERPRSGELWVTVLDVGQGAAVVIEARAAVLVYDTGPRYSPQADAGSRIVLPYLRARGIRRIDVLVLSHLDSDHSGGAAAILKVMEVGEIWTSIERNHPLLAGAADVEQCAAGHAAILGDAWVRVLHPEVADYARPGRSTNARSCVLELRVGRQRVLLTGDLPQAQELELVARTPDLRASVVTAPHHGSRSSSSEPFVRAAAPTWVVAQTGYHNRFGHPDPVVVARYRSVGAEVVRTDSTGAIQWKLAQDGAVTVRMHRMEAARYWRARPGRSDPRPAPQPEADPAQSQGGTDEPAAPRD
jgi:competence protein ComEC